MNRLGPFVVIVLGVALGAATQGSHDAAMGLRVPALFAALLMVGQGMLDLAGAGRAKDRAKATSSSVSVPVGGVTDIVVSRPVYVQQAPAPKQTAARFAAPVGLMVLSMWLGLAVLFSAGAFTWLSTLSTIAAFMLFALGWQLLMAPA